MRLCLEHCDIHWEKQRNNSQRATEDECRHVAPLPAAFTTEGGFAVVRGSHAASVSTDGNVLISAASSSTIPSETGSSNSTTVCSLLFLAQVPSCDVVTDWNCTQRCSSVFFFLCDREEETEVVSKASGGLLKFHRFGIIFCLPRIKVIQLIAQLCPTIPKDNLPPTSRTTRYRTFGCEPSPPWWNGRRRSRFEYPSGFLFS